MNAHEPGMRLLRIVVLRPIPRWEQRLWIGAALGMSLVALVPTLAAWPSYRMPVPLFVASNLVGIVVVPVLAFLLCRTLWRLRREKVFWGLRLILLSVEGMAGFSEYALVYALATGPRAPPISLPSAALPFAIAILALFALGFIEFVIEPAVMVVRFSRRRVSE